MEFEKDRPVSQEEQDLAGVPHLTVDPVHSNVSAEYVDAPRLDPDGSARSFEFDSESTVPSASRSAHGHRHAMLLSAVVIALFIGMIAVVYFLSR